MNIHCLQFASALLLSIPMASVFAQAAPAPARAASAAAPPASAARAPRVVTPPPRPMTTTEASQEAVAPGVARSEFGAAVPQVSIPIGKQPPVDPDAPVVRSGVDDRAARCEAMKGEQNRVKCRDQVARDNRNR